MGTPETSGNLAPIASWTTSGGFRDGGDRRVGLPLHQGHVQLPQRGAPRRRRSGREDERPTSRRKLRGVGGLFSAFDCTMVYVRQKEDPWNSIVAGAAAAGFLQMRQGLGPASRSAVFGAALLALIEGAGIMLNRFLSVPQNLPPMEDPMAGMPSSLPGMPGAGAGYTPQTMPGGSSSSSSWFGGLFGGKKNEEAPAGDSSKTRVLESFDAPSTPVPTFDYK
ncbi:unnamed protein product [Spirodela intermedia]|uniref:Uncharacterized protein n=1 Tax=Spirodela intermedia TaxID=51605 RepID=A0A7I8JV28_SPIIN|nr:unnamed protein product [Spirodela intermedia]CAA6673591.1 unnamed protein product [Spirodela intermedia]